MFSHEMGRRPSEQGINTSFCQTDMFPSIIISSPILGFDHDGGSNNSSNQISNHSPPSRCTDSFSSSLDMYLDRQQQQQHHHQATAAAAAAACVTSQYWDAAGGIGAEGGGGFITSADLVNLDSSYALDCNASSTAESTSTGTMMEHFDIFATDFEFKREVSPAASFISDQGYGGHHYRSLSFPEPGLAQPQPPLFGYGSQSFDEGRERYKQSLRDQFELQLASLPTTTGAGGCLDATGSDTGTLHLEHLAVRSPRRRRAATATTAAAASAPASRRGSPQKSAARLAGVHKRPVTPARGSRRPAQTRQWREQAVPRGEGNPDDDDEDDINNNNNNTSGSSIGRASPCGSNYDAYHYQTLVSGAVDDPFRSRPSPAGRGHGLVAADAPLTDALASGSFCAGPTTPPPLDPGVWSTAAQLRASSSPRAWPAALASRHNHHHHYRHPARAATVSMAQVELARDARPAPPMPQPAPRARARRAAGPGKARKAPGGGRRRRSGRGRRGGDDDYDDDDDDNDDDDQDGGGGGGASFSSSSPDAEGDAEADMGRAGGLSIGFVNYTAMDHDALMAGVAPSGSSKTKARREKEQNDREERLKEAFMQAFSAVGGNAGVLVPGGVAI